MAKLQVKTEKIINLIEKLKRTLRENNDISLFIRGDEKNKRIVLDYSHVREEQIYIHSQNNIVKK